MANVNECKAYCEGPLNDVLSAIAKSVEDYRSVGRIPTCVRVNPIVFGKIVHELGSRLGRYAHDDPKDFTTQHIVISVGDVQLRVYADYDQHHFGALQWRT